MSTISVCTPATLSTGPADPVRQGIRPARWRGAALLAALALLASGALAQASVLEAPRVLTGARAFGEAGGVQWSPDVAAGGQGSLAVWLDHRSQFDSPLVNQGGADVYAIRLDADGQPLDAAALRLPHEIGDKTFPKAAWNGSAWLVVWENQQPLGSSPNFRRILGARIAADGTLLDATPIVVRDDFETTGNTMAVASDGVDWVVVVQGDALSPGAIMATKVSAAGTVLNPGGTMLVDLASAIFRPDLEYANGRYLLVYSSGTVQGLRFSAALAPIGGTLAIGSGSSAKPRVASDGSNFLVVWETAGLGRSVRARRVVGATGTMSTTMLVTADTNGDYNGDPDVAWGHGNWLVALRNSVDETFRIARISPLPAVLDFGGVVMPFGASPVDARCRLARTATAVTAVFELEPQDQQWPGAVLAASVDGNLTPSAPVTVSLSAPRQGFPALAAAGHGWLAAFVSEQSQTVEIQVQRLDAAGRPTHARPTRLAAHPRYRHPAVAWNGTVFLVVWEDPVVPVYETDDRVLGMRVSIDGRPLDAAPIVVMDGSMPDVAAQGGEFLVVASVAPATSQYRHAFARRVGANGQPLGAAVQLGASFARFPHAAPLGSGWVVTWQRNFSHDNPYSVAEAALVAANGTASPSFVVAGSGTLGGASRPSVARADGTALLVWQDVQNGIGARLVNDTGAMLAPFAVAPLPAKPALPAVAWSGEHFLIAWQDARNRVGLWDRRYDVFAARVSAQGTLLDPAGGFAVADGYETESMPDVAGADGHTLIAWTSFVPQQPLATLRIATRRHAPTWAALGHGLAGTHGVPVLSGSGSLTVADPGVLSLGNARASTLAIGAFGFARLDLPLLGGTMVPDFATAPGFLLAGSTDAAGSLVLTLPVPPALGGVDFFAQHWVLDPAGPFGFSASNAVRGRLP